MHSSVAGKVCGKRHSAWLVLCLLVWFPDVCLSQNELLRRSVRPPYPLSFTLNQVRGARVNYGSSNSPTTGNVYRPLALSDGRLFIGAKDQLFSVDPESLSTIDSVTISVVNSGLTCCGNYIRVVEPLSEGVLLVCGTNNLVPVCQQRASQGLATIGDGQYFATDFPIPVHPHQNFSWLLLNETGYQIFSGTYRDALGVSLDEPSIARSTLTTTPLLTSINVDLWTKDQTPTVLDSPQFVGDPIEYNGRIYFFFREIAQEHINGGRIIYSRVAAVCKDDAGGTQFTDLTANEMVTFVKARLECSIDATFPYYYNEIQDVYHSTKDNKVVFAIFATRSPGIASSAVCAYRLDEIETLFLSGSKYRAQQANGQLWTEVNTDPVTPRPIGGLSCPNTKNFTNDDNEKIVDLAQLMNDHAVSKLHYETTGSTKSNPLLISYGERFTQLEVDEDVLNSIDVMFIGTENGTVLKAYLSEDGSEGRIVEEIVLNSEQKTPVLDMLKSDSDQAVFIGTDIGVYRIPFQHCQDYTTREDCLNAKDLYCKWIDGSGCVYSDATGQQDLDNGAGDSTVVTTSNRIVFHRCPASTFRLVNVTNHQLTLTVLAEAPAGMNLRVAGDEIKCTPCDSLPYTSTKFTSSGSEFLVLYIDGSSSENKTCSCTCVLEIDGGVNATATFTLTADDSDRVNPTDSQMEELVKFDNAILAYKHKLKTWFQSVGTACKLDNVQACPASGCPSSGCP